jgi:FtsP/CotA-like multicopper oxidase with cupredoxin domain
VRFRRFLLISFAIIALFTVCLGLAIFLQLNEGTAFVNNGLELRNRLSIPPQLEPRMENGEKVFDLTAQEGEVEFFDGKQSKTLGFNGDYLGPTIRARAADKVRLNVTNNLDEITTVHWHGMHLPPAMDGGPHQTIEPGESWQPNWTITNEAATLWYHPHQMEVTGEQVYRGLAGLFIIDDDNADSLAIPREYGVDDIPLIVQDRKFDDSGQFVYQRQGRFGALPGPAGMLGDTILVNGTLAPYVEVPQKLVRLRVLNASSGRRYNFGFSDNRAFHQIATDGGLLEAPVERTRMLLAPAERAEIVVDLSDAQGPLTLMSYAFEDEGSAFLNLVEGAFGDDDEHQEFQILELRPQAGEFATQELPRTLNTIERLDEAGAATTRRFILDSTTINNQTMDHTRIDETVKKGDVEVWELQNQSPFYHPFHIHGAQFLVLDRDGAEPPEHEQGWKDTVIVKRAETVRVIMQFKDYSDPSMPYMFHCHILEHEDAGMMGQFAVVDSLSDDVGVQSPLVEEAEEHRH